MDLEIDVLVDSEADFDIEAAFSTFSLIATLKLCDSLFDNDWLID